MNEDLKIAKITAKAERLRMAKELTLAVIENPVVDLIAGVMLLEWMASRTQGNWLEELVEAGGKVLLQGGLVAVCTAKALSGVVNSPGAGSLISKFVK